ncbi:MAG TPA: hypothetical protein VMD05_06440 [Candidatus Nanoarchaeia archaeon]|nr:hypothetical protein [Candidatus Nanoarchaeia archaeon]
MNKNYHIAKVIPVLAIALLSLSLFVVVANAQYQSQQTVPITVGSNGVAHIDQSTTGGEVSMDVAGVSGATGSVSVATYIDNPQPGASTPSGTTLANFIVISFDMNANDFQGANMVFHYTDSDVAGINAPYTLYKYIASSNSYVLQNGVVDSSAKTITLAITSLDDPLFAIGGTNATATTSSSGVPSWVLAAIILVIVVFVVALAVLLMRRRKATFKIIDT